MSRLVAALAALLVFTSACGSREERSAQRAARAERLVEEGRIEDALIELQAALKIDPKSAAANQRLAELLRDRGSRDRAIFHFGEAYQLDPTRIAAALAQAELLRDREPRRADRIVAALARDHPEDPHILRAASSMALAVGDHERALASARAACDVAPDASASWLQLGRVHLARARVATGSGEALRREALAAFDEADRRAGGDVAARLGRARVWSSWPGRRDDAVAAFRSALDLARSREDETLRFRAAVAFERFARDAGDVALVREALRHQTAAAPHRLGAWQRLADATAALEGEPAEIDVYGELVSRWPESPAAHVHYTASLSRAGRLADAIGHLETTIAAGLDHPDLFEQLVRLELERGAVDAARRQAAALRARPDAAATADRADARIALAEGQPDAAAAALGAFDPAAVSAESEALRARIELARGRVDLARTAAERAAGAAPGFSASAQRMLAEVHAEAADWPAAAAALDALERHGAALGASERLIRARALYAAGEREAGRAQLEALLARPDPAAAVAFASLEGEARPDLARAHLERALEGAPYDLALLEAITAADLRDGRVDEAKDRLDRAVAPLPGEPGVPRRPSAARLLRAEVLAHAGDLTGAEADALRALEDDPDLPAPELLVSIYRSRGVLEAARASFEEAEAAGKLPPGARRLLAQIQAALGDSQQAIATTERLLADRPDLQPAKRDLARLLASRGEQLDRALELAEESQRARPGDPAAVETLAYVQLRRAEAGEPGRTEKNPETATDS